MGPKHRSELQITQELQIINYLYFIDYAITVVPFIFSLLPPPSDLQPPAVWHPSPSPYFMSTGHTYNFFDFSVSYTILNLFPSILCLPIMLLILSISSPILPIPLPTDNPPCDLHLSGCVPVLVVCLVFLFDF